MLFVVVLLAFLACLGHLAIWVPWVNRVHSTNLLKSILRIHDLVWLACVAGLPVAVAWSYTSAVRTTGTWWPAQAWPALAYVVVCWAAAILVSGLWLRARLQSPAAVLHDNHTQVISLRERVAGSPTGDRATQLAAALPGNQILQLNIHEKRLKLPRLAEELAGLSVVHLTDLHITGQMSQAFYEEIVRQANTLAGDIVVVTGDILDRRRLMDWLPATLGKLESKHGVYFVLGNHDRRTKRSREIRHTLTEAGLVDLGSRWEQIEVSGQPVVLAGNELPWFPPAADMENCPAEFAGHRALRILLSHAPDQIEWARRYEFDLMLAGHCHGGQFRLPVVGPILSPSRYGVRYASGTFHEPPTVLHVSRGIAGTRPLRFNCPPELTKLVLES